MLVWNKFCRKIIVSVVYYFFCSLIESFVHLYILYDLFFVFVFFNKKPKRLQKKYQKMMKLYAGTKKSKSHNDIRTIGGDEFKFMSVNMDNNVIEDEPVVVETKKDKKKKRK